MNHSFSSRGMSRRRVSPRKPLTASLGPWPARCCLLKSCRQAICYAHIFRDVGGVDHCLIRLRTWLARQWCPEGRGRRRVDALYPAHTLGTLPSLVMCSIASGHDHNNKCAGLRFDLRFCLELRKAGER